MKNQKWLIFCIALKFDCQYGGRIELVPGESKARAARAQRHPDSRQCDDEDQPPGTRAGFTSTNVPEPQLVLDYLPPDTSYAERIYTAPDGFWVQNTVVLMGGDRTSIHKPDYCLPGQGWVIKDKSVVNISIAGAQNYDLPVAKWVIANSIQRPDGQKQAVNGLYVFWLVADGEQTADNYQRMWWMGRDLLRTGVLQRWAYVSYFVVCAPGQEDAAFERMKNLIAHSVPEFQKPPPKP